MWFVSEEDEQRFAHALLASLLVHVLVLGYVRGVEPLRTSGSGGALNVSFRAAAADDQKPGAVAPPPAVERSQPLLKPAMTQARIPAPPLPSVKPPPLPPQPAAAPDRALESGARGIRQASNRGPGVVEVRLVIGTDGHPQGIYWDSLPALTVTQFEQLEAMLRRQVYASSPGARLTQEIDVFALLGIGHKPVAAMPPSVTEMPSAQ
jgi:hypothetical protein